MTKLKLHWQILIALVLAGIIGTLTGFDAQLLASQVTVGDEIQIVRYEGPVVEFTVDAVSEEGINGDEMFVAYSDIKKAQVTGTRGQVSVVGFPSLFGVTFYAVFGFLGTIFLNALKMLIVPLIASSIIVGVAGIGSGGNLGRLGGRTMMFYILSTSLAIIVGLVLVNMVKPGLVDGQPAAGLMALSADVSEVAATVGDKGTGDLAGIFIRMVPANIVKAAAEGEMLGLIFFCLLFGYFMSQLPRKYADTMFSFWDSMFQVMMRITHWVMNFAPYGVFGLVAKVVAETGFDAARPLLVFTVTVIAALAFHALITLPLLVRFIGRVNPWKLIRAVSPALLTAFSTSSSSATLPITIDSVEKNVGVSNRVSSFVLPLGATVNMDGTALYECMAALFIAQAYGVALTISQQVVVVVTALLTSIGVAVLTGYSGLSDLGSELDKVFAKIVGSVAK